VRAHAGIETTKEPVNNSRVCMSCQETTLCRLSSTSAHTASNGAPDLDDKYDRDVQEYGGYVNRA
jgi:hypothetical protein